MDTTRFKSAGEVYKALQKNEGSIPREAVWQYLEERGIVNKVIAAAPSKQDELFRAFVKEYRRLCALQDSADNRPKKESRRRAGETEDIGSQSSDERRQWLSKLLALDAARDWHVASFRKEALGDKLLEWDQVESWIQEHAEVEPSAKSRRYIMAMRVASPDVYGKVQSFLLTHSVGEIDPALIDELAQTLVQDMSRRSYQPLAEGRGEQRYEKVGNVSFSSDKDTLAYTTPDDVLNSRWIRVSNNGALYRLAKISRMLAEYYGWKEEEATVFILTDMPPRLFQSKARITWHREYPALDRMTLEFDPTMSPKKLAAFYAKVKQGLRKDGTCGLSERYRQLSEKMLNLALFTRRNEGKTVRTRLQEWNNEIGAGNPEWKYKEDDVLNFDKHSKKAVKDLIGEE